jgi:hypothetical protein
MSVQACERRIAGVKVITVIAVLLGLTLLAPPGHAQEPGSEECVEATVVAPVQADAWIDFNSQLANKGSDAVLEVGGDARALVRFRLPSEVPAGCVLESARLRVFADSGTEGARVEALRALHHTAVAMARVEGGIGHGLGSPAAVSPHDRAGTTRHRCGDRSDNAPGRQKTQIRARTDSKTLLETKTHPTRRILGRERLVALGGEG